MTMQFPNLNIVAIGDEETVSGLRLAGVTNYYAITDGATARDEVRQALTEAMETPGTGIIAIQEEYTEYAEDIISEVRRHRNLMPIIIEVPSKHGTRYGDVAGYYKSYVREFTGFEVEI